MNGMLRVRGGERVVREEILAEAEARGVAADAAAEDGGPVSTGDVLVDLGLPPEQWRTDLREKEAARVRGQIASLPEGARYLRVSLLGANAESHTLLKSAAGVVEREIRAARPDAVILRVGVLLGDTGLTRFFRSLVERARVVPVPGISAARFEPLALEDLASYVLLAAADDDATGEFDLSCGELLTGGLFVRGLAENLGLERWCVPLFPALGPAVAASRRDPELPARAVSMWLEYLADGSLPRRMTAWKRFDLRPAALASAMAAAVGMSIPVRPRGEERFGNWRTRAKHAMPWTRRTPGGR